MKTFAYLALIGTALAVRLTSGDDAVVDEQAQLEALADSGALEQVSGADLGDDAAECLLKGVEDELDAAGMKPQDKKRIAKALKEGRDAGKTLGDAADLLKKVGQDAGVDSADVEDALGRAGKKALECLKEKREEPATDGDDQEVVLAQEDDAADADAVDSALEEIVEKVESGELTGE